MTLRVAFHQTVALRTKTGVGHYAAELFAGLAELGPEVEATSLPGKWTARAYRGLHSLVARKKSPPARGAEPSPSSPPNPNASHWRTLLRSGGRSAQDAFFWNLQRQLHGRRFDLYHEPNFPVLKTDLPTVLTLCDLSLILTPEHHPADRVRAFERQLPAALKQTRHIVTISHFVREEILRVLGWPAERVTTAYLGVRPSLCPRPQFEIQTTLRSLGLPNNYLLYVGTLEPRKNLTRLLRAYCRLPSHRRDACPLLLVGGWGWNTGELAEFFHAHARHHGVRHVGYVPDEHLAAVYGGARALVYPSHYEGFGLPPLEMMACGGPVICSKAGALKELFAGHAHLIDAEDDDGWTRALDRILRDDDWRRDLQKGVVEYASQFTWRRCAEETAAAYRLALALPTQAPRAAA